MKLLKIEYCQHCPYQGECGAWKKLTKHQRMLLTLSNSTPKTFILEGCHLDDDPNCSPEPEQG